jgi:transcriptional regulator with XRE-family HTH domain
MDRDDSGPAPDHRTAATEGRAAPAPSQIGEALWRGRSRMGLSLDEVARRTGIDLQTVSAIENSDFARMPGASATIVAARAYARLVNLPEKWVALTLAAEQARIGMISMATGRSATDLS